MNKRGVTLIELLGAIVLMGIIASLTALFISVISNANRDIALNSRANTEGLIIISALDTKLREFKATDYSLCAASNCITLENHFDYVLDTITTSLILQEHVPPLTLEIELLNSQLYIDGVLQVPNGFTLDASSAITITETAGLVQILIQINLLAPTGEVFHFSTSNSFEIQAVPA